MRSAKALALQEQLEAKRNAASSAVSALRASRHALLAALTERRVAYNAAGLAASEVAVGSAESKDKVAAIIAAIPIVESVVASMRTILSKVFEFEPRYTREAGIGYGMALYAQSWEAADLPIAIGQLRQVADTIDASLENWQQRLSSLVRAKDRVAGARPEAEST